MDVKLHKGQVEIVKDNHRFKIICAGRRWGKSVLSQIITLKQALDNPGLYFIVSPTYKQSKMIHWRQLLQIIPPQWIQKKNEVELSITLQNKAIIELKGAENPDALRGVKLRGLVIDEIASIRNWDWLWSEVLRPTLTDYQSPAIFISTPKGFNHFHELYKKGLKPSTLYKSWRFTSYDNPYILASEIDSARSELTEDTFAQEYLADFRKYTGLVYKEFIREVHVIDPFDVPEGWTIIRGMDYGSTNPTVCLWIAIDNDNNWFVVDEYYVHQQTIDYHAGQINAHPLSPRVAVTYVDPSGAQWMSEFSTRGVYSTPATKEKSTSYNSWVRFGIDKVRELLKRVPGHTVELLNKSIDDKGRARLYISASCQNLIREFETYRWKEKSVAQAQDINEPDVPEKANDHALDALRYVVVSYSPMSHKDKTVYGEDYKFINPPTTQWRIGR